MPFDGTLPKNNAPIVAAELRNQLQAIQNNVDAVREQLQIVQPLGCRFLRPGIVCQSRTHQAAI